MIALAALLPACERPEVEEHAAATRAVVPGVESVVATTAPLRDVVRAYGSVTAEAEPPEVRDARTALAEAEARRSLAAQQVRRLEALAGGVAPRKELEAARAEETAAAAAATRAQRVLAGFGPDAAHTALGAGEVWLTARVLQLDVLRVERGAEARFAPDALAGGTLVGRVDAPAAYVDPATQTAPVRVRLRDADGVLRPGMTGAVTIEVGPAREAIVVPALAVVYDGTQPLVFVADEEEEGRWTPRHVQLGTVRDGRIEIASGLAAGARVATTGASSLLSATRLPAGGGEED